MSQSTRQDHVAPQFSPIPFCNENAAVVRETAGKRMLHDSSRRPVVIAFIIDSIEDIDTSREVKSSSGMLRAQFEVGRCRGRFSWGSCAEMMAAAARC